MPARLYGHTAGAVGVQPLFGRRPGTETGGIDIIVRTSTAAVFGYFLSANYRLEAAPGEDDPDNSLQVVTTAGIGLFCLLTLLVFRAAALLDPGLAASDSATATLAQFRDFVSGCVGFLIGSPGGGQSNQNQL